MKKVILIGFPVLVGLGVIFPVNPVPKVPGTRKGMCLEGTLKKARSASNLSHLLNFSPSIFSHSPLTTHQSPLTNHQSPMTNKCVVKRIGWVLKVQPGKTFD